MDKRHCLVRCLTSPTLIRMYSVVNMVVWGTVLVLSHGIMPVLHGCAGIIISIEGIFAAASKSQRSIKVFLFLMLLNLVFCVVMGPLTVENIYVECYCADADDTIGEGESNRISIDQGDNVSQTVCVADPFCERAFRLYGWILIIFGAILQLPIFLCTLGFFFAVSRPHHHHRNNNNKYQQQQSRPTLEVGVSTVDVEWGEGSCQGLL